MSPEYAIIVAGGKGTRMKSSVPKQFMELHGLPILMHTINAFLNYDRKINIILVLPEAELEIWQHLCEKHQFQKEITLTTGGDSRFGSVKNGLDQISEMEGLVAIHDGVRPLVSIETIRRSFHLAAKYGSAVAAVKLKESLRKFEQDNITLSVNRSNYRLVQTPQTFNLAMIKEAYEGNDEPDLTDDASVVEKAGHKVWLFEGSYENLKITSPEDLIIAEALLTTRKNRG